ncbi:MAG: M56 family metallopeptidase [Candidatus Aminicenantes bacterium]|nr:M56 family metallopeptidase [Candidatus Aminicenantes bacterium]
MESKSSKISGEHQGSFIILLDQAGHPVRDEYVNPSRTVQNLPVKFSDSKNSSGYFPRLKALPQFLSKLIFLIFLSLSTIFMLSLLTSLPKLNFQPIAFLFFSPQLALCSFNCLGLSASLPYLFSTLKLLVFLLFSFSFIFALTRALPRVLKTRRFLHSLRPLSQPVASSGISYYLFPHPLPLAFTAGFLHPKIYISVPLARGLNPSELNAVLHHELHHQQKRDPLKSLLLTFFSDLFFFIPISSHLQQLSELSAEIAADLFCLQHQIKPHELAQSFLKVSRLTCPGHSWFAVDQKARLEFLTKRKLSFKPSLSRVLISIALLLLLFTIIFQRGDQARVNSFLTHNSSCPEFSSNNFSSVFPGNFSQTSANNFYHNSQPYFQTRAQPHSQPNSQPNSRHRFQSFSQLNISPSLTTDSSGNFLNNFYCIPSTNP